MAAPRTTYLVNYTPATNGGRDAWTTVNYNGPNYQADLLKAKAIGFNTVRVNFPAYTGVFDFPAPSGGQLAVFADFYSRVKTAGMRLQFAGFDLWTSWGLIAASKTWLTAMLGALPDLTAISAIELRNEQRFASTNAYTAGFDAGWPSGTAQAATDGPAEIVWAQQMTAYIRATWPGIPVVASCSFGTPDIQAYVTATRGTAAQPDWYDWHSYSGLVNIWAQLATVIGIVGDPANLFIGETGLDSATTTQGAVNQAEYLAATRWACQELLLPEPAPWILFDLTPSGQFPSGQKFGLYDAGGVIKPSGKLYQRHPPGAYCPPPEINGDMGTPYTDGSGNVLPNRWSLYKGAGGAQPITATIDSTITYAGQPTVLLSGSAATDGGDNPPALQTSPPPYWPAVSAGHSYTFDVMLQAASGTVGNPQLAVSWYSTTQGGFISTTSGAVLTITGTMSRYSLTATAPTGAVSAVLFLRTPFNAGQIRVGAARWKGPGLRLLRRNGVWQRHS